MDPSQRANAAQMAARNIKSKPKARAGRTPFTGPRPGSSGSQFAPPSQNGGGLFGGSIQGTGSFNFSAPGGMNFAPSSFASNATSSRDVSDNEGRFAGDDRAMKRQFGGPSTMQEVQQPGSFGQNSANIDIRASTVQPGATTFTFGSSSGPSFSNTSLGSAPASNPFSLNPQPVSASPSISFGSGTVESKPANSPFQFFPQAAQAPSINSPFNFKSSAPQEQPATPQVQSLTSTFDFSSTAAQNTTLPQAPKSPFTFGPITAQENPAPTPLVFGQSPAAPPSSAINFGSEPATASPASNLFGTPQPAQTANIFSSSTSNPTTSLFGGMTATSPSIKPLFGSREQSPAPTSNNFFGASVNVSSTSTKPSPTPNLFGEQKATTSSNIFGGQNKPTSTNNMFGSPTRTPAPSGGLLSKAKSEQELFETVNKPVDESVKQHKADSGNAGSFQENGTITTAQANSPFNKLPESTLFGRSAPLNKSNSGAKTGARAPLLSTPTSASYSLQENSSTSPIKHINAPMAASQPPPGGMFSSLPEPGNSPQKAIELEPGSPLDDLVLTSPIPIGHPALASGPDPFNITKEHLDEAMPDDIKNDAQAKGNWVTRYRIEAMNNAMLNLFNTISADQNPRILLLRYMKVREQLIQNNNVFQQQFGQSHSNSAPANQSRNIGSTASIPTPNKQKLVEEEAQEIVNSSKRTKEQPNEAQVLASPAAPEPKPQSNGFGSSEVSKLPETSAFKLSGVSQNGSLSSFATPSPTKNKRKAESQITKYTEEASPLRQIKTPRLNGSTIISNTSNIFKNILDSPSPPKSGSPNKPMSPVKKAVSVSESKDDTPKINPFGLLPLPASPATPGLSPSPSAPALNAVTTRASSASNLSNTNSTPALPSTFTPKVPGTIANPFSKPAAAPADNSASQTKGGTLKPPVFTSGPVDFLAQFGKKASNDQKDNEEKLLQKAIDADYDSDDDLEEFKQNYREKRKAELKELEDLAKNARNAFVFKADGGSAASSTLEPSNKVAATTEAAPKPFFNQSNAQGSGNSVFSSLDASRNSTPGPFGSSTGSVLDGHAPFKQAPLGGNIFAHLSDADSGRVNNDVDGESAEEDTDGDEENRDPNYQPGEDTASVFGTPASETGVGIASVKKTNFFSNYGTPKTSNLFGGPASSTSNGGLFGRVGGKEALKNEQSGTSIPGGRFLGKIGSQEASAEKIQGGATTPGALLSRVGSKDASTEKEQSGTTTPGGSLFDRITKDSSGNPVRHISTEEKENTQPSTANVFNDVGSPFGSLFNKTPGVPADKTWKPDSPIRFGAAADTEASSSAPTVSITAATPTKSGSTSNLFGGPTSAPASNLFGSKDPNPAPSSTPFSNLFGSSSSAKGPSPTSVGFGFGEPSITSSLFPSAAGSANTSRTTSPGAAADAGSGVDGDTDAEVYEQINLTAGGPGEEDEEVLHEIRAKAHLFSTQPNEDGSQWITKGIGPLRVLQHKDTKAVRILLRADPLGTIVLNKALLGNVQYAQAAKTVKILATADDGKGLETWLLQVKTEEAAKELADVLEANKPA